MNLMTQNNLTMSSLEISELTGKRHDVVLRDIRVMLAEIRSPQKCGDYKDGLGRSQPMLLLDKNEALCLVAGYNSQMRMAIIKRWQELESKNTVPVLPNFNNPADAARAWAEQFEANQCAQQKLIEAQPKVDFVDRYVLSDNCFGFREVCKKLHANESRFREFLLSHGVMYYLGGKMTAKQVHIDAGRFKVMTGVASQNNHAYVQPKFTTKGVEWIAGEWAKHNLRQA